VRQCVCQPRRREKYARATSDPSLSRASKRGEHTRAVRPARTLYVQHRTRTGDRTEKTTGTRLPLAGTSGGGRAKSTGARCPTEPTHSCRAAAAAVASLFMRRLTRSSWPWARRLKTWQPQRSERELRHRRTPRRMQSNRSGRARSMNDSFTTRRLGQISFRSRTTNETRLHARGRLLPLALAGRKLPAWLENSRIVRRLAELEGTF